MSLDLLHRRKASTSDLEPSADGESALSVPSPSPAECGGIPPGCVPIAEVAWRQPVRFVGRVRSLRVQPWSDVATLECTLVDDSGGITVVFLGRRTVPGIRLGSRMVVQGTAGSHHGKLAVLNPDYTLLAPQH
jgi:hypothetical protein